MSNSISVQCSLEEVFHPPATASSHHFNRVSWNRPKAPKHRRSRFIRLTASPQAAQRPRAAQATPQARRLKELWSRPDLRRLPIKRLLQNHSVVSLPGNRREPRDGVRSAYGGRWVSSMFF